jgi:hypothetical protein
MEIAKMLSGGRHIGEMLFVLLMVGCRGPERRQTIAFRADNESMREEVLRSIPIGTRLAAAEEIMTENAFGCSLILDEKSKQEMLYCVANEPTGFMVARRWMIFLYINSDTVTDVKVTSGNVGP